MVMDEFNNIREVKIVQRHGKNTDGDHDHASKLKKRRAGEAISQLIK